MTLLTVPSPREIGCPVHCAARRDEGRGRTFPIALKTSEEPRAPFGVVGLGFRTAPLEVRSRVGLGETEIRDLFAEARRRGFDECVVLSTCNRLEVYHAGGSTADVAAMLSARAGLDLSPYLYEKACGCAACHAFQVASGLDSAVLGETEIVAQVKAAWALAREEGMAGPMLDLLFQRSLEASKRVRSETELCRTVTSTASLAVRTVRDRLDGLEGRRLLVLGAGQIGRRLALELQAAGAHVRIANRTLARAQTLADDFGAEAVPLADLEDELAQADAVFAAATVSQPLVTRALLQGRAIPIVDMGVPPNVEPGLTGVVDIDALSAQCEAGQQARLDALPAAAAIVEEELGRFHATLAQRTAAPTIRALVARGDAIRARNLDWARERLPDLTPKEMRVVEEMARRLTIGLLEAPIDGLKGDLSAKEHRHVVEQLFGLTSGDRGD